MIYVCISCPTILALGSQSILDITFFFNKTRLLVSEACFKSVIYGLELIHIRLVTLLVVGLSFTVYRNLFLIIKI